MSVPEERQAGAQGVMGASQALVAGITAILIGAAYEAYGRATAYAGGAIGMVLLTATGMALAARFWRSRRHETAEVTEAPPAPIQPYS